MKTATLAVKPEQLILRRAAKTGMNGEKESPSRCLACDSIRWLAHQRKITLAIVRLCAADFSRHAAAKST